MSIALGTWTSFLVGEHCPALFAHVTVSHVSSHLNLHSQGFHRELNQSVASGALTTTLRRHWPLTIAHCNPSEQSMLRVNSVVSAGCGRSVRSLKTLIPLKNRARNPLARRVHLCHCRNHVWLHLCSLRLFESPSRFGRPNRRRRWHGTCVRRGRFHV
jgi:hypothetical protein